MHALPLAAIEFADRNLIRNIADNAALYELHQPLQRPSSHRTVSPHSGTPHCVDPSWHCWGLDGNHPEHLTEPRPQRPVFYFEFNPAPILTLKSRLAYCYA